MMTFHFFQGCMYRVRLEEMTWIPSSNYENHAWPPSLASCIKLMYRTSDLMKCLESLAPQPDNIPDFDVGIIGGAAFVWV